MEYRINLIWDDEAKVWIATSEDIAGLVLESDSLDKLMDRVVTVAPKLLELNEKHTGKPSKLHFVSEKYVKVS